MPESTAKKQLMEQDESATPAKKLVPREINGWMETKEKTGQKRDLNVKKNSKFSMGKRLPPRRQLHNANIIDSSIENLKKRKDELMKSIKKWNCDSTNPNTIESNTASTNKNENKDSKSTTLNKKPYQFFTKLPLIHVNQFTIQQQEIKYFRDVKMHPSIKQMPTQNLELTSRRIILKKNYNIQDENQNEKIPTPLTVKNKVARSGQVLNFVNQKIPKNNYAGLLASLSRKQSYEKYSVNKREERLAHLIDKYI